MIQVTLQENINQQYEDLAKAIVIQAAEDYKRYRFVLDTIDLRKYKDAIARYDMIVRANREITSAELFFKSNWFNDLSGLDGKRAIAALQKTYVNEYYPNRMKEWEESNGRAKGFIKIPNN